MTLVGTKTSQTKASSSALGLQSRRTVVPRPPYSFETGSSEWRGGGEGNERPGRIAPSDYSSGEYSIVACLMP